MKFAGRVVAVALALAAGALLLRAPAVQASDPPPIRTGDPLPVLSGLVPGDVVAGDFTRGRRVLHEGRARVLKSSQVVKTGAGGGMRWANLESYLVSGALCRLAGLAAPRCRVVSLDPAGTGAPLIAELGAVVLEVEWVDESWEGRPISPGRWPGWDRADRPAFAALAAVDLLIANGDRTGDNFLLSERPDGKLTPVPTDENAALGTPLLWTAPISFAMFGPAFEGPGAVAEVLVRERQYANVHAALFTEPASHTLLRQASRELAARLTDREVDAIAADIPDALIPVGAELARKRREEIARTLKARRDGLARALDLFLEDLAP